MSANKENKQDYSNLSKPELIALITKYEEVENKLLAKIEIIVAELQNKNNFDDRLISVERRMALQEQYTRRECIEIVNIPVVDQDVNLEDTVVDLFKDAGVNVNKRHFHAIHRLKNKTTIIAKLVNRRDAIDILRKKKVICDFDETKRRKFAAKGRIYVNESLCPAYKKIFGICNSLFKMKKVESFYTINPSILLK